jgi:hypothetical protein
MITAGVVRWNQIKTSGYKKKNRTSRRKEEEDQCVVYNSSIVQQKEMAERTEIADYQYRSPSVRDEDGKQARSRTQKMDEYKRNDWLQ